MEVAIIGGGLAGYQILKGLLNDKRKKEINITLFDDKDTFGRGIAFQKDDKALLLNYPSNFISLKKDDHKDFYNWVKKNKSIADINEEKKNSQDEEGNIYFSRQLFGQYLTDYYKPLISKKRVNVVKQLAKSCRLVNGKWEVIANETYIFDYVFLAPGPMPSTDFYNLSDTSGYIAPTYPLSTIPVESNKSYAIIGTGLSAIDCIRFLNDRKIKVIAASRKGVLPSVRGKMKSFDLKYFTEDKMIKIRKKNNNVIPLEKVVHLFKKECDYQGIDYMYWTKVKRNNTVQAMKFDLNHHDSIGDMHSILYDMSQLSYAIWPYLTLEDQEYYNHHYKPLIETYSNPMPEPTATELITEIMRGTVQIKGGIKSIDYKYRKYRLTYEDGSEDRVHYVINATGPSMSIEGSNNLLLSQLLKEHYLMEHPSGGIVVVPYTNDVISPLYGVLNMVAVGQITSGVNYANNGITELLMEAERAVNRCYNQLLGG